MNVLCHLSWEQKQLSNRKRKRSLCASHFVVLIESLTFLFISLIGSRTTFPQMAEGVRHSLLMPVEHLGSLKYLLLQRLKGNP